MPRRPPYPVNLAAQSKSPQRGDIAYALAGQALERLIVTRRHQAAPSALLRRPVGGAYAHRAQSQAGAFTGLHCHGPGVTYSQQDVQPVRRRPASSAHSYFQPGKSLLSTYQRHENGQLSDSAPQASRGTILQSYAGIREIYSTIAMKMPILH